MLMYRLTVTSCHPDSVTVDECCFAEGLFDQYISQQDYKPVWTPIQSVSNSSKYSACSPSDVMVRVLQQHELFHRATAATPVLKSPLYVSYSWFENSHF